jgi:hypothetical protein
LEIILLKLQPPLRYDRLRDMPKAIDTIQTTLAAIPTQQLIPEKKKWANRWVCGIRLKSYHISRRWILERPLWPDLRVLFTVERFSGLARLLRTPDHIGDPIPRRPRQS